MNTSTNIKAWTWMLFCLLCTGMYAQTPEYAPNQFIIKMKAHKSTVDKLFLKNQMQATTRKTLPINGIEVWEIPDTDVSRNIEEVISEYRDHPDIEYIEPDYYFYLAAEAADGQDGTPSDPDFDQQWGLNNTGQNGGTPDADINAPEAWDIATGSPSVKVAVIDTGIDWKHPDLIDNIWQNLGEDLDGDGRVIEWNGSTWIFDPDDINDIDDDGNGYADDFIGWNFVDNTKYVLDANGHGTHVAGIIGANGNNNTGISGVTWEVQLVPLRVFAGTSGSTSNVIAAIAYAIQMNIPISNNSYEHLNYFTYSMALRDILQTAEDNGHLYIAAAGNNSTDIDQNPNYPASFNNNNIHNFDNVISVAAINRHDALWASSNYGVSSVSIGAPGEDIYSTHPMGNYGYRSGTSMATPHVTGACALLMETYPDKSYSEIKDAVLNTVTVTPALTNKCTTNGRLNLYGAMNYLATLPPVSCRERDSLALVALYEATDGANWWVGWDMNRSMEFWHGVTLNDDGCVIELRLHATNLNGVIPPEIGDLSNLIDLQLSSNKLSGNIPPELWNLSNLVYLYLSNNQLTGNIPSGVGSLSNLVYLNLSNNQLTGNIPPEIGNLQMYDLLLDNNQFQGNIPPELGSFSHLFTLDLSNNQLSGRIPAELGNLGDFLELSYVGLHNNQLSGCYDENLGNICFGLFSITNISEGNNFDATWEDFCNTGAGTCSAYSPCRQSDSLALVALYNSTSGANWTNTWDLNQPMDTWYGVTLNLEGCVACIDLSGGIPDCSSLGSGGNNLSGNIPPELGNLSNVRDLYLHNNQLSGSIPPELGNLGILRYLLLEKNQLSGSIPPELGNLNKLQTLYLDRNQLSGSIPPELGNLSSLGFLDMHSNQLSGSIPPELGNLNKLQTLYLDRNQLTGNIPTELGNLSNLVTLDLTDNQLSDSIPPEIGNLNQLEWLRLARNQLTGNIPTELGNLSNLVTLDLTDNQLSGSIPPEIGNLSQLEWLYLRDNQLSGSIPSELSNLSNLFDLFLSDNQLSGSIPRELGNLINVRMPLHNNQLSGCYDPNLMSFCDDYHTNNTVSNGNNFDATWEDFCNMGAGSCGLLWPGDYNYDGTVDETDPLYWGLASGFTGPVRPGATTAFEGQQAPDWQDAVQGINSKHQDGNGDGIVDGLDLQVVDANFGNIHNYTQPVFIASDMQYELVEATPYQGQPSYDLYVYDSGGNEIDAHGLAGVLEFYDTPVTQVLMRTNNSSLMPSDTLTVFDNLENRLHFALTRSDRVNQTCTGAVANFVVAVEDIPTDDSLAITIENGTNIQANGDMLTVAGVTYNGLSPTNISSNVLVVNTSTIHVQCNVSGSAWVTPMGDTGPYTYQWNTGESTDRITDLSAGIYDVTVTDAAGTSIYKSLIVEGQYIPLYDAAGNPVDCQYSLCPTLLTPDGAVLPGSYQADRTINSDGTLTGDTEYKAGEVIILDSGFEIPPGTEFSGTIEDCDGN